MKTLNEIFDDNDHKFLSGMKDKEMNRRNLKQYRWRDFILDLAKGNVGK